MPSFQVAALKWFPYKTAIEISIFVFDFRLLRRALEHCVWSKQYILKSFALFAYSWVKNLMYTRKFAKNKSECAFVPFPLDFWIIRALVYFFLRNTPRCISLWEFPNLYISGNPIIPYNCISLNSRLAPSAPTDKEMSALLLFPT